MEDAHRQKKSQKVSLEDRNRMGLTGINSVIAFDENKVILESEFGNIVIKGNGLHVNHLSVEQGELEIHGRVDSFVYTQDHSYAGKKSSFLGRLLQ